MLHSRHAAARAVAQQYAPSAAALNERLPANPETFLQAFQDGSFKTAHLQHLFMSTLYKERQQALLAATTDPQQRARLLSLMHKNPLPNLDPADPLCLLHNDATVIANRLALGLPASALAAADPYARCACGQLLSADIYHFGSCPLLKGLQIACHNDGYRGIANSLQACGIQPNLEHKFLGTNRRVDLSWTNPQTGSRQHVDYTVCNPAARSVATAVKLESMTAMRPLLAREDAKKTKHTASAAAEGYSFFPWVVDPFGATTITARKLVQQAVDTAATFGSSTAPTSAQFLARIAATTYRGTAAIYAAGLGKASIRSQQQHL